MEEKQPSILRSIFRDHGSEFRQNGRKEGVRIPDIFSQHKVNNIYTETIGLYALWSMWNFV